MSGGRRIGPYLLAALAPPLFIALYLRQFRQREFHDPPPRLPALDDVMRLAGGWRMQLVSPGERGYVAVEGWKGTQMQWYRADRRVTQVYFEQNPGLTPIYALAAEYPGIPALHPGGVPVTYPPVAPTALIVQVVDDAGAPRQGVTVEASPRGTSDPSEMQSAIADSLGRVQFLVDGCPTTVGAQGEPAFEILPAENAVTYCTLTPQGISVTRR